VITLAVIWIAWCALHSLLISRAAHNVAKNILGARFPLYRLYYVGFSLISLVPVLWYQFSLPSQILIAGNWPWRAGQAVLLVYAGFMFYAGARVYDMDYFLGLSQWRNFRKQKESGSLPFHSDGVLAYVRHPWYSGGIALLWGFGTCTDVYLLTRTILTVYFVVGTVLEEVRLKKELGEQYIAYCRKVPMLIPWKKQW
jgi:protein-S-isoprenylcysteine O-methyltransferase Ste14